MTPLYARNVVSNCSVDDLNQISITIVCKHMFLSLLAVFSTSFVYNWHQLVVATQQDMFLVTRSLCLHCASIVAIKRIRIPVFCLFDTEFLVISRLITMSKLLQVWRVYGKIPQRKIKRSFRLSWSSSIIRFKPEPFSWKSWKFSSNGMTLKQELISLLGITSSIFDTLLRH